MIRTHIIECHLSQTQADALNCASGQRYTQVMLFHWRTYSSYRALVVQIRCSTLE